MLKLLLALIFLIAQPLRAAEQNPLQFDLYVPVDSEKPQLAFNHVQHSQLEDWAQIFEFSSSLVPKDQNLELHVYLPDSENLTRVKNQIEAKIQDVFSRLDTRSNLRVVLHFKEAELGETEKTISNDLLTDETIAEKEQKAFAKLIAIADVSTARATSIKRTVAGIRLLAIMATRYAQTGGALSAGGEPAVAAGILIFGESALEGFTIRYIREIQERFASISNRVLRPVFRGAARAVGVPILNLSFFSIGWPLTMQVLTHIANPTVPLPNVGSASSVVAGTTFDTLLYVWIFTKGYENLRDKGWLTNSQIDVLLQLMGTMYFVNGMINSNPNWYHLRYFTWIPTWGVYALIGTLGKLAPTRRNRIVLVESSIKNKNEIWDEQFVRPGKNTLCESLLQSRTDKGYE